MTVAETNQEWQVLQLRVHTFAACAVVSLQQLPEKLNPIIKALIVNSYHTQERQCGHLVIWHLLAQLVLGMFVRQVELMDRALCFPKPTPAIYGNGLNS